MADDFTKTVRIKRPSRVAQDERGRNVWVGRIEEVELKRVSTTALETILRSADDRTRGDICKLAAGRKDGILARDTGTGVFQIVSAAELRKSQDVGKPPVGKPAPEMSFVSTQILRKTLKPGGGKGPGGGFDPYNSG